MNLEVDVMEGDRFVADSSDGKVVHRRGEKSRYFGLHCVSKWFDHVLINHVLIIGKETPIDLPTFTRYCEGCGLTVKEVKLEPAVETIKPPEWWLEWKDGGYTPCTNQLSAVSKANNLGSDVARIVRIDWWAK